MLDITKSNTGKKVKVVKNTAGHSCPVGSIGTITSGNNNNFRLKEYPNFTFYTADLELCPETREQIEETIKNLQDKVNLEQIKLKFMSENNMDEFDETQYKVFQTLITLENKDLSPMEKSKLIASLLES